MTGDEFNRYFKDKKLESRTPNSVVDIDVLRRQLPDIKREDIAYDDEEYSLGVRGVSSGIRNDQGKIVGAICVIGPSVRLSIATLKNLAPTVQKYAMRISRELGYHGSRIF
jgi:IclR family pca regulon transcriptional regulator